jgi:hypothetical protein
MFREIKSRRMRWTGFVARIILLLFFGNKDCVENSVPSLLKLYLPSFPCATHVASSYWILKLYTSTVNVTGALVARVLAIFFDTVTYCGMFLVCSRFRIFHILFYLSV